MYSFITLTEGGRKRAIHADYITNVGEYEYGSENKIGVQVTYSDPHSEHPKFFRVDEDFDTVMRLIEGVLKRDREGHRVYD